MKKSFVYLAAITMVVILSGCNRVDETKSNFDNVVYLQSAVEKNVEMLPVMLDDEELEKTIQSSLALPHDKDVHVTYKIDFSLVDVYNLINDATCEPLNEQFVEMEKKDALIVAGNVRSTEVTIKFKDLKNLPAGRSLLLPVTIVNSDGAPILNGSKTVYFLLKKGRPITMAANILNTHLELKSPTTTTLQDMKKITMEAIVRLHDWGGNNIISTVMGVEEHFLLRIGDDRYPRGHFQAALSNSGFGGGWPPAGSIPLLELNTWYHLAFTFDCDTREAVMYIDGQEIARDLRPGTGTSVTFNQTGYYRFLIGKSWDDNRQLRGDICEARIWNIVRTPGEIDASKYGTGVKEGMRGLQAWWKFDEGMGSSVNDYSGNRNNLTVGAKDNGTIVPIEWTEVSIGFIED